MDAAKDLYLLRVLARALAYLGHEYHDFEAGRVPDPAESDDHLHSLWVSADYHQHASDQFSKRLSNG